MRKSIYTLTVIVSVGVTAVACSSDEPAKPEPATSSTAEVRPTADTVTREEGADQYLKLVAPFNEELDKCVPAYNRLLDASRITSSDFSKLREDCKDIPEANRTFADELTKAKWPEEAQESVAQLVDEVRADQLAWQEVSEVQTHDDLFDPKYPLTEDGPAAGLVRAHLGLPPVEELEE